MTRENLRDLAERLSTYDYPFTYITARPILGPRCIFREDRLFYSIQNGVALLLVDEIEQKEEFSQVTKGKVVVATFDRLKGEVYSQEREVTPESPINLTQEELRRKVYRLSTH